MWWCGGGEVGNCRCVWLGGEQVWKGRLHSSLSANTSPRPCPHFPHASQVSLLRLHQDCAELAGLNSAAAGSGGTRPSDLITAAGQRLPLVSFTTHYSQLLAASQQQQGAGAAVIVVSPAVQALVRKLLTARRRMPASSPLSAALSEINSASSVTFEVTLLSCL